MCPERFGLCLKRLIHGFSRRTGFNRQADGTTVNPNQQKANGSLNPSPTNFSAAMLPPLTQSSSFSSNSNSVLENGTSNPGNQLIPEHPKFFFQERFAKLGVKGNFMPLAAQPTNVELADWLAHQSKLLMIAFPIIRY